MRKRLPNLLCGLLTAALTLAAAARAPAAFEAKMPVSKQYENSEPVVIAAVTEVIPRNRLVRFKTTATIKGKDFPDVFQVQIRQPANFVERLAPGQPLVLFVGAHSKEYFFHLGDQWLTAGQQPDPNSQPPLWRCAPVMEEGAKIIDERTKSYPGRTEALVRVVNELKQGKSTLLNNVDNKRLRGGVRELAKLGIDKPTSLLAADVNGDKKPDLLVGAAGQVKLLIAGEKGYDNATTAWGLDAAKGATAAAGDVNGDGKIDLLIGDSIWMNDGKKFAAAHSPLDLPAGAGVAAAALLDVNGDVKPDAVYLLSDGQLIIFTNLGAADGAWPKSARKLTDAGTVLAGAFGDWGDNGKPHALVVTPAAVTRYPLDPDAGAGGDFTRLTGEPLNIQRGFDAGESKAASARVLDLNGDGRRDVLLIASAPNPAGVALVNRGFGAFVPDADAAAAVIAGGEKGLPFKVTASTPIAAADLAGDKTDDLLVLSDDGRLFIVDNPPAK